jgi:hypothetical protein
MATRHNLCPNPAASLDVTGWTSNSTPPTRADVTALGFARPWAAYYTAGSVLFSPSGAASPGMAYTVSAFVRPVSFALAGTIFIEWLNAGGGSLGFTSTTFTAATGTVTRFSWTAVAPANTAFVHIVVTGENYGSNPAYYTMCLIEQASTLNTYFDGDSPSASWDGTPGASTSTLTDTPTPAGTLAAALPAAGAAIDASVTIDGALATQLPALQAAVAGTVEAAGQMQALLPPAAATLTATATADGQLAAQLPPPGAALNGVVEAQASLTAALPALATVLTGQVSDPQQAVLAAALPAPRAALTGSSDAVEPALPPLIVQPPTLGRPGLGWAVGEARVSWSAGPPELGGE